MSTSFDPRSLNESLLETSPFREFDRWFAFAERTGVKQPEAMSLATAALDGTPSLRLVLFKGWVREAFSFYTHYPSRKGRELGENPKAALAFHWPEHDLQIRAEGGVERTTPEESEAYFHSRPRESQLGAHASQQGALLDSPETFHRRYREAEDRFRDQKVPLPQTWGGFRVVPDVIEFWVGKPYRLHDRFVYLREPRNGSGAVSSSSSSSWKIIRLYP
jgi:pyridoxamine 5'-phosphate oxidase